MPSHSAFQSSSGYSKAGPHLVKQTLSPGVLWSSGCPETHCVPEDDLGFSVLILLPPDPAFWSHRHAKQAPGLGHPLSGLSEGRKKRVGRKKRGAGGEVEDSQGALMWADESRYCAHIRT